MHLPAPLRLDDQLCFALYGASMAVGRAYKPKLDELGITYPQFLVLAALWEQDRQSIGAIAKRLALESSTVTPLAKRLAAAGLVERTRNPENERQTVVSLTEPGWEMRQRSTCLAEALVTRSGLSLNRLRSLNREVKALRDAIARDEATERR